MDISAKLLISDVERDTGIGKDTLRVWERRYGFPSPVRSINGERLYSLGDLNRLLLIKRLLDVGCRPKQLVSLSEVELAKLLSSRGNPSSANLDSPSQNLEGNPKWMSMIRAHEFESLRNSLRATIEEIGVEKTITEVLVPLTRQVGEAWLVGDLAVYEEHLYTESVSTVLIQIIAKLEVDRPTAKAVPKVLLTTFPQEKHSLGLLMAECFFGIAKCQTFSLGCSTPLAEIEKAAVELKADIVALSFTAHQRPQDITTGLDHLRSLLPIAVEIWIGGNAPMIHRRKFGHGIKSFRTAQDIIAQVQSWRDARSSH
jgi:DNA-binding transcriptional MerR regulator/methylmalonyl-CoA mutase cobalamin-binding subunit